MGKEFGNMQCTTRDVTLPLPTVGQKYDPTEINVGCLEQIICFFLLTIHVRALQPLKIKVVLAN